MAKARFIKIRRVFALYSEGHLANSRIFTSSTPLINSGATCIQTKNIDKKWK